MTRPAIEAVADMLEMAYIRALEVASFYFMFQLQPVGSIAHIQVCGTTSCMICGAEDLIAVCKDKIANKAHEVSADGKFSWEEVECLGSCTNAPMAQIGKDYYEDLTAESFARLIDELSDGKVPTPGPQNGRYAAEPLSGLTSLTEYDSGQTQYNASVQLAKDIGDTVKRIDGTEVPLLTPWVGKAAGKAAAEKAEPEPVAPAAAEAAPEPEILVKPSTPLPGQAELAERKGSWKYEGPEEVEDAVDTDVAEASDAGQKPLTLDVARDGGADDLKLIKGVGPKLEGVLNGIGVFHFDQIAAWTEAEVD